MSLDVVGDFGSYVREEPSKSKRRKIDISELKKTSKLSQTPGYNAEDFKPGYMINVKVENFTTYAFAEFKLSPTLNMIIGPNGTGKSTLVAAICLGLGGKIDLIKRKTMKSMIKTGCSESSIVIELKNKDDLPNILIQRDFTEKSSTWYIDGSSSDEKSVKKLVQSFNIQLDNLCHFLPQERVAEFATLSPERLLLETERTLGDGGLLKEHESLILLDSERLKLTSDIQIIDDRLSKLNEESGKLEEEVKKYEDYEKKTYEIHIHSLLIPYGQIQDFKSERKRLKEQREEAKRKLEQFQSNTRPLEEKLQSLESEHTQLEQTKSTFLNENGDLIEKYESKDQDIKDVKEAIDTLKMKIENYKKRNDNILSSLEKENEEKDKILKNLNDIPMVDEHELQELNSAREEKHAQLTDIQSDVEEIKTNRDRQMSILSRIDRSIKEKQNRLNSNDKIDLLRSRPIGFRPEQLEATYKAIMHLRQDASLKNLYEECPIVSCDVVDPNYAKYVERCIDRNSMLSVFCPDEASFTTVRRVVGAFRIPLRTTSDNPKPPPVPKDRLKDWGFDYYVSDLLKGPPTVLNCLNVLNNLNQIPVSLKAFDPLTIKKLTTPDNNGRIPFMRFIAGDTIFSVSRSKYGSRQYVYQSENVMKAQFLGVSGLSSHIREEISSEITEMKEQMSKEKEHYQELQSQFKNKRDDYDKFKSDLNTVNLEYEKIKRNVKAKQRLEQLLQSKEQNIKKLTQSSKKDQTDKIMQAERKLLDKFKAKAEYIKENSEISTELARNSILLKQHEFQIFQIMNQLENTKALLQTFESRKEELQAEYDTATAKYKDYKNKDFYNTVKEQSANYTPEERRELTSLTEEYLRNDRLSEYHIRQKIMLLEDERSVMSAADHSSIELLRRKKDDIDRAEKELPRLRKRKDDLDKQIASIQSSWESKLSKSVSKISKAFQKRFTTVASDGQVELVKEERFKNWRLQILVKFRENTELKILDHQSQSGGERAVSTIFFIMSLQGLTDAPFRVVDEINQGMDPKNEKMAHRYLVNTACQTSNSQYFLVTPKLLTGLYYHPKMAIHCIYTGTYVDPIDRRSNESDYLDMKRCKLLTNVAS